MDAFRHKPGQMLRRPQQAPLIHNPRHDAKAQ